MQRVSYLAITTALLLNGCATDRDRWSLRHAYMSPRARRLQRAGLEEIVWLVSHAWSEVIIGVGQACGDPPDTMHVVARYGDYRTMVFDFKIVKTDFTPVPLDKSAIQSVTPSQIYAWEGLRADVDLTPYSEARMPSEEKWYALTGRVVDAKVEADGDIH